MAFRNSNSGLTVSSSVSCAFPGLARLSLAHSQAFCMRCRSVRLLLVAMFATQHTDFESFANALGALLNQPPVPMACEPSPSPIDVDTNAIVQQRAQWGGVS